MEMDGNQKYQDRQENKKYYSELMGLVLKIEDMKLQANITAAINSIPCFLHCIPKETKATQTWEREDRRFIDLKYSDTQGKRKRRRSKKGPEVIPTKKVIEILSHKILQPSTSSTTSVISKSPTPPPETELLPIPSDQDLPFVEKMLEGDELDLDVFPEQNDMRYIQNTMIEEFISCYKQENGFYPIQAAIMEDNFKWFQRQLYVLNFRKINLNEIFTEENHLNLLELAINSKLELPLEYFENLLKYGMKYDTVDESNKNSILDVIVRFSDNVEYFSYFLKKLPLDFLTNLNSDGCGILHMCVKKNQFKMVQILLDHIDACLQLKPLVFEGSTNMEKADVVENVYKEAFLSICERKQSHETKEGILNLQETTSGRTPLLMALSSQYLHIAYMLLNHLADPSIKDFSGNDALAFLANSNKNNHLEDVIVNVSTILKELRECL